MRNRALAGIGLVCSAALVASACGNTDAGSGGGTVKVGLLTTLSGPASATFAATPNAVRARFEAYKAEGGKCAKNLDFKVVTADDTSSPQGALAAAQKLVQRDQVHSVLTVTASFYGASPWLTTQGRNVPVVGSAFDGAKEWKNPKNNLFPAGPVPDPDGVYTTAGKYLADQGGKVVAGIAYNNAASQQGLKNALASAKAAGLKTGYVNSTVPLGSTDVGAAVLGIIHSRADVLQLSINPDTSFAILAGLRQAGYRLKASVLATGYGKDLLESAPAVQAGQGASFTTLITPNEMKTTATERLSKALKKYADSKSGIPSFAEQQGWLSADLYLHGLEATGCDTSQSEFISALRKDTGWNADGLYPKPVGFSTVATDEQCLYYVKLAGKGFVPVKGATPLCGKAINGT
ncbi:ABC transporter substrate-binding protein [Streptomyces sp. NPDC057690]|uniref:ABC transporter substrate-binding protein n=1 Tax=Streptomyces sp. NPDC057690 TaxID=3346214 RepID=UPI0036B6EB9B